MDRGDLAARDDAARARLRAKMALRKSAADPDDEDLLFARIEAERQLEAAERALVRTTRNEATLDWVEAKNQDKKNQLRLVQAHRFAKGNSKALAASYVHKQDFADNKRARAIRHHWGAGGGGSHYHMAGSRQFQLGNKVKGVISRHSKQGARFQAQKRSKHTRMMQGQEAARGQRGKGGGSKQKQKKQKKKVQRQAGEKNTS